MIPQEKKYTYLTVSKTSNIYEISTTNISNGVFIAQIESKENSSLENGLLLTNNFKKRF